MRFCVKRAHRCQTQAQPHMQVVQDRAYELLPQQEYVAKRRFHPKPPVLFRTWSTPYVKLADALAGNVALLLGRDEAVLPEDHLSQKQSLRLEVCASPTACCEAVARAAPLFFFCSADASCAHE